MSEESLEKIIKLLETISYDAGGELSPVLMELKGIREELVKVNEQLRKIRDSAEKIEEKYRWARIGR